MQYITDILTLKSLLNLLYLLILPGQVLVTLLNWEKPAYKSSESKTLLKIIVNTIES